MKSFKIEDLQIGDKLIVNYYPGNINNQTYHVRGFVDGLVAVRVWRSSKRNYEYSFLSQFYLDLNSDYIKLVRHKKGESHDTSRRSA